MSLRRMRSLSALLLFTLLAGCEKHEVSPPPPKPLKVDSVKSSPVGSNAVAEAKFGGSDEDERALPFTISRVLHDQKPSKTPPFYEAGGNWTMLIAKTRGGCEFIAGQQAPKGKNQFSFSKAFVAAPSREAGDCFVKELARALHTDAPEASDQPGPLEGFEFGTAVLGQGMSRSKGGGYSDEGTGDWFATKWFLQLDDYEAELFFNFSEGDKKGEFSEKDEDYDADAIAVLAQVLRDGRAPERTPENDPTLSATGPTFGAFEPVSSGRYVTVIGRSVLVTERRGHLTELFAIDALTRKKTSIGKFGGNLMNIVCVSDKLSRCALLISHPKGEWFFSSDDPTSVSLLENGEIDELAVPEAGETPQFANNALSPDGHFLALEVSERDPKTKTRSSKLVVIDLQKREPFVRPAGEKDLTVVGWKLRGGKTVAVVREGSPWSKTEKLAFHDWVLGEESWSDTAFEEKSVGWSPDGKQHVTTDVDKGQLVLTGDKAGKPRTLKLDPRDAKYVEDCCQWLDNRYLQFPGARATFLDSQTMKLSYPLPREDDRALEFTKDFKAAIAHGEDGVSVAPVILPKGK